MQRDATDDESTLPTSSANDFCDVSVLDICLHNTPIKSIYNSFERKPILFRHRPLARL